MNVTNNLKLPQYTEEDIFDLQDINKAYDSIDKAYKEVIDFKNEIPKTNATAEVIDARGGKKTLGERLNEFDEQLDNKANKNEVIKKGQGTLNDFDEETRRVIQGMEQGEINAVLGQKNVTHENLANNSVDYTNIRDRINSINLFNKYSNYNIDGAMLDANGAIYNLAKNMFVSDYIEVTPGSTLGFFNFTSPINSNLNIVLYDKTKKKLAVHTDVKGSLETTADTYFIRFSNILTNKQTVLVKYGVDITEYEDFYFKINGIKIDNTNIEKNTIDYDSIKDGAIKPNKTDFAIYGKNLIDKSKFIDGQQLDNNGNLTSFSAEYRSSLDFLEIAPNTTYTLTGDNIKIGLYNEFKKYITSSTDATFTTTNDTRYVRITVHINSKDKAQLELGDSPTSYEPYCLKIPLFKDFNLEQSVSNVKNGLQKVTDDIAELQNISLSEKRIKVSLGNLYPVDTSLTVLESSEKTSTSSLTNPKEIASIDGDIINPIFRYTNAQIAKAGEIFPRYKYVASFSVTGNNGVIGGGFFGVEFDIDCKEFELLTLGTGTSYKLAIDDGEGFKYTNANNQKISEPDGSGYITKIVFPSKKLRRVRFEVINGIFGGVNINKTDMLFPISLPKLPLACYTGSSITEGGYPWLVSQILGMDCINAGVGSTGYVNPGLNNRRKYIDRADNDLIKPNPDLIVIEGGINDSGYEIPEVIAEADKLYKYIRSNLPNVKLIVIGMYWPRDAHQPVLDMNKALRETCLNNQIAFIDLLKGDTVLPNGKLVTENMGAFINGTGNAGEPNGSGNSDVYTSSDKTHPTQEGKLYISQRIATEIYKILQYI